MKPKVVGECLVTRPNSWEDSGEMKYTLAFEAIGMSHSCMVSKEIYDALKPHADSGKTVPLEFDISFEKKGIKVGAPRIVQSALKSK